MLPPFLLLIPIKMELLSNKIKGIVGTLATEVEDANKEYVTEKISAQSKKEQINCSVDIANYRAINAIKGVVNEVLVELKSDRAVNPTVYEKIKELFNGRL